MEMRKNRDLYEPLDLCYHKEQVRRTALKASCAIRNPAKTLTLCGRTIIIQIPNLDQWTSTIGGLLKIRGGFYALTTSHMPDDDDGLPEDEVDYESDDDRGSLFFFDKGDDSECEDSAITPFEFDNGTSGQGKNSVQLPETVSLDVNAGKSEARNAEETKSSKKRGYRSNPIQEDRLRSGDDWLLVPVAANLLYPNRVPEGAKRPATWQDPFIESFCPDLGKLFVDEDHPDIPPSQTTVWAISGMGGLIRGNLCPNPSFIISNGGERTSKVWKIEVEGSSQGFQTGDSGSWVVDDRSGRVLGILLARVGGNGYMVSFASVRQDIISTLDIKETLIQLADRRDPQIRVRGGRRIIRSFHSLGPRVRQVPVEQAPVEQALDTRSWGQWLSHSMAETLDFVRHPVDLGYSRSRLVLFYAMLYVFLLLWAPGPWES
ncbi:hypothetical protein BDP81DRAFT_392258 [Colletotrichum phormii]|uniref:Uncharacterized protein n=1 Tax=Colletotrichum phormii TaxID=359342 RepID=A0AAI9ZVA3_9PEZI|nr:uncharacterized protein BDP81DRAFT_392258 [Colletotrichum phormii]KAK1638855.1 hypothetical protein BDP81DRAFT_392258 [Colletotrichum phormii]